MGVLVLYPATFSRPSEQQIADLVQLLVDEQIITKERCEFMRDRNTWCDGPNFHRLGVWARSSPMTISFSTVTIDEFDPDELDEEWEKAVALSSFTINIQDSGPADLTNRDDPIWQQMETTLGDALAMTYYHI